MSAVLIRSATFARLCRARDLLAEVDAPRSIAAVARASAISPYHFIRQFHAVFGVTPHQWRIDRRLERAQALLAAGGSVTDACLDVGFSSVGSFSALFTRRLGVAPSAYRRAARVSVAVPRRPPPPGCFGLLAMLPVRNFREAPRTPAGQGSRS
jgi:AraC-like DNA-binding protein